MLDLSYSRYLAVTIGSIITSVLVYYAGNKYGPGLTHDSINYLYAGHALYEKGKFLRPMEEPYIEWSPLYPFIIACLNTSSHNLLQAVFFFQVVIAGITVGLSGKITSLLIKNRAVFYIIFAAIVFSTPLILVNHFVWSESVFLLLLVWQIQLFFQYTSRPTQLLWALILLNGMLLTLQRHTGVLFIVAGACILLVYPLSYSIGKKLTRSVAYGLISVLPLLFWWIRNYHIKGLIMNDFRATLFVTPFSTHWSAYNSVFTAWFLPDELPVWLRIVSIYGVFIGLLLIYMRFKREPIFEQRVVVVFTICVTYFILAFLGSLAIGEFIDDRILAPVYIPAMLLSGVMLEQIFSETQMNLKKWVFIGCILWLIYPISRSIVNVYFWHALPKQIPASQPVEEEFRRFLGK